MRLRSISILWRRHNRCLEIVGEQCNDKDDGHDSYKIGSGGKLVKGVDGDGKMSLDEGNSR